jgi:hypothetical protein
MNTTIKTLILMSLLGLAACGQSQKPAATDAKGSILTIKNLNTGAMETVPAVLELADGSPIALYASKDNHITLLRAGKTQVLDTTAPVQGGNTFQLHAQGNNVYASWWSHQDNKNLYFSHSTDAGKSFSKVAIVNDNHGVLPRYSLNFGSNGVVGATYYDERSPKYEVYFNRSTDFGQTWARPDTRLDSPPPAGQDSFAVEPITVHAGNSWVTVWDDAYKSLDDKLIYHVLARQSMDEGKTWGPVQELYSSFHPISSLTAQALGDTVLLGFDEYQVGITAFISPDAGATWHKSNAIEGSVQKTNSGLVMAMADGYGYFSWIEQEPNEKPDIKFGRFDLAKATWAGKALRVDTKAFNNTQSTLPTLYAFDKGAVVLAWLDYRDIRPNVYLSLSTNQGETWSTPKPFSNPGLSNLGYPRLVPWNHSVALAYEEYPSDNVLGGSFILAPTGIKADSQQLPDFVSAPAFTAEQKEKMLVNRIHELWKYRIAGNYEPTYKFFDFAMRRFMSEKEFLDKSGNINFFSYELVGHKIEGNVADVDQKVTYDSKPIVMPNGKTAQIDKVTAEVKNTWVWVGDNWYLVYAPSFGKPLLTY